MSFISSLINFIHLISFVSSRFHDPLGIICWNISLRPQTPANKCNGTASNSCLHLDEDSRS